MAAGSVLNGRYQLEQEVGAGGFARVYLARDLLLQRRVALMVLHPQLADDADVRDFRVRFTREAQAVAALDHPHMLPVYDYGEADGLVYLVMPYVDGGTLFDRLREQRTLALPTVAAWVTQAAAALDHAHRAGLVHRDVKPHNMLLRAADDCLLLADFGIAKVLANTDDQSRTGAIGTIAYMAPEQFQGRVAPPPISTPSAASCSNCSPVRSPTPAPPSKSCTGTWSRRSRRSPPGANARCRRGCRG